MKLVVLSEPEWIKYPFIVHRYLNSALEFAQGLGEPFTLAYPGGYETGAVRHAQDWHLRRYLTAGYEDVEAALIYPNTRWMFEDTPNLVLAFEGPPTHVAAVLDADDPVPLPTRTFQMAQHLAWSGAWVKFIDLPVPIPKEPKDAPSAMDVLHGKLAA